MGKKSERARPREARAGGRQSLSEWAAALAVLTTVAFLVGVAAPQGWYAPAGGPAAAASAAPPGPDAGQTALVRVVPEATESGFTRAWRVQVSDRATGRPAAGARVTLSGDHVQMPGAHPVGPVEMQPTGKPGEFRAELGPIMPGTWDMSAVVTGPVSGTHRWREPAGAGGGN